MNYEEFEEEDILDEEFIKELEKIWEKDWERELEELFPFDNNEEEDEDKLPF